MTTQYILGPDGEPVIEPDLLTWGRWFEGKFWHIAFDVLNDRVSISTCFLGLDHNFLGHGPPILWETMVFEDGKGIDMQRYSSRAAALEGHRKFVEEWRTKDAQHNA